MKKRVNPYNLILIFVVMGMTRFSYLLPGSVLFSFINIENIISLFVIFWAFLIIFWKRISLLEYKYWWVPFCGIALILLSSLQGYFMYPGQGLLDGVIGQISGIAGLLLYFPVADMLFSKKITVDDLENVFLFCSLFQMSIYFIQFIIGPNHVFLSCYYLTGSLRESVNRIRLYGNIQPITIALFFCLNSFVQGKKTMRNIFVIVMTVLFAVVVNQGRGYIISIVIIILSSFILQKKEKYKLFFTLLFVIAIIYWLINTDFFQSVLEVIQNSDINTMQDTLGIRYRAQEFFMSIIKEHLLLGGGYPNMTVFSAYIASGYGSGYRLVDVGIYAFVYKYGLIGCLWAFYIFAFFVRKGIYLRKNYNDIILLLEVVLLIIDLFSSVSWFDGFGFYTLMIWIVYFEALKRRNYVWNDNGIKKQVDK